MVRPSIWGMMVEDRDHVRITVFVLAFCNTSTFFISFG
jgi:hypothetical protein